MINRRLIGAASTRARAAVLDRLSVAGLFVTILGACASGETPVSRRDLEGSALGALAQPLTAVVAAAVPDAGAGEAPAGPSNDCCSASGSGGCSDESVAACVCEGDAFCCSTEYDALCVKQAVSRCGQDCDTRAPVSDCCSASDVPGCSDAPVAACICEIDPFCCVFRFDQSCVNLGVSRCNLGCGEDEAVP